MGNKAYNESHRKERNAYAKKYRDSHRAILTIKSNKWMNEHPEAREKHRKYMIKYNAEHKPKTIKTSIKQKFDAMNQDIERFNKRFEPLNIDNIAKAIDDYMSIYNIIKLEMNNKLWIFLKDKFGEELTEHRYRFLLSALKKSVRR